MRHTKFYVVLALIAFITFSCTKDEIESAEESSDSKVLEFDSKEAMEQEIVEVLELKKIQELSISEKLFGNALRNFDFSTTPTDSEKEQEIDQDVLLESVKLYHQEKLNGIYELRNRRNFTSIQSIADEINFLTLIDPKKGDKLADEFKDLLVKTKFGTTTVFGDRQATILNVHGEVYMKGQKLEIVKSVDTKNPSRIREGVLALSTDNTFGVTWHTGAVWNSGTQIFAKLGGWIIIDGVPYPFDAAFSPNSGSYSIIESYNSNYLCGPASRILLFPSGFGPTVESLQINTYNICRGAYYPVQGKVSGDFATILANGQILRASGSAEYNY